MNPRRKMTFACDTLLWTIVGFVVSSSGQPLDVNEPIMGSLAFPRSSQEAIVDKVRNVVVPQVGVLEERADVGNAGKDTLPIIIASGLGDSDGTIENAGNKGILVPIVIDGGASNKTNPLVALLPLPSEATLPPVYQQPVQAVKPEIRRSLTTGYDDNASGGETMDIAEDIVFRPLFRIRQATGKIFHGANYRRRYNVNGYYRLPYNYYPSNYRNRYDYSEQDYRRRSS